MKTCLLVLLNAICFNLFSQTTITLQPNAEDGKDAKVFSNSPTNNYGEDQDFIAAAWTWGGTPGLLRSYLQFDLSSIPDTSIIISAKLSLYYNDESTSNGQEGENASYLRRVIEDWDENTINWTSKPDATTENQVYLSESVSISQDYTDINVKDLIIDMIENPEESFGFLIILDVEETYASMKFCTSDFIEAEKRPKLEIVYSISKDTTEDETPILDTAGYSCVNLQPGTSLLGIDAKIWDLDPTNNFGTDPDFISAAWTWGGTSGKLRSLLKFDMSSIPAEAIIESAYISLYYNHESTSNGQEGENEALLRRITSSWDEDEVTWDTQPSSTSENEVTLNMSTSIDEDYINIDVTELVADMIVVPEENYGFLFRQVVETTYRSMKFYSSDADVSEDKKPKLLVCYSLDTTGTILNSLSKKDFEIYPNPFTSSITISGINQKEFYSIKIFDITGRLIHNYLPLEVESNGTDVIIIDLKSLIEGVYVIQLQMMDNTIKTAKLIK